MRRFLSYLGILVVLAGSSFMIRPQHSMATAADNSAALAPLSIAPFLSGTSATSPVSSSVVIDGRGFTPSGKVYIVIYAQRGIEVEPHEPRWITATGPSYFRDGRGGGAQPGKRGGTFHESFDGLCGTTAQVRAYDQMTAQWSPFLNVTDAWLSCGRHQ